MTPLGQRIASLIQAQGPISIAQFMTIALHDREYGYYATRDPLGADFITSPEISQMFGELLGLWMVQCWYDQGKPEPARFVELGPGRGTLMADALRAAKLAPDFLASVEVVMVENSPELRAIQQQKLADAPADVTWRDSFEGLDDQPLFLIANEFFDALPIRQYARTERGWCERMVVVDANGELAFSLSPVPAKLEISETRGVPDVGAIYEVSSSATALIEEIARIIADKGGAALIVDYGYGQRSGFGETFQAVGSNDFKNVLADVGGVDLSAHVDFGALVRAAESGGAHAYGPVQQKTLLENLGIQSRADNLSRANLAQAEVIDAAMDRLLDRNQMGELFKAIAIVAKDGPVPAVFEDLPAKPDDGPESDLVLLQAENLSDDPDIEHGFFGRGGGYSKGIYASLNCGLGSDDDRANVIKNRQRPLDELAPDARLVTVHQIHSNKVITVSEAWDSSEAPQADAMVTNVPEIALGILTADCAPVLFADAEAKVIGAAHAGWKGAIAGITDETIKAMEALGANRSQISAAIGPCISQKNYEVGPEFRETFLAADSGNARFFITSDRASHFRFDLEGYVVHRLQNAGIGSIEPLSACTYARESEFFSFRRTTHKSEPDYGREISMIVLL